MEFIEGRNQRGAHECEHGPLQAPSRAEAGECAAPGAEKKNAQRGVSDKVPGLAQYDVQNLKPLRAHSEQIMKDWIENSAGMFRGAEVARFHDYDRQPDQ